MYFKRGLGKNKEHELGTPYRKFSYSIVLHTPTEYWSLFLTCRCRSQYYFIRSYRYQANTKNVFNILPIFICRIRKCWSIINCIDIGSNETSAIFNMDSVRLEILIILDPDFTQIPFF